MMLGDRTQHLIGRILCTEGHLTDAQVTAVVAEQSRLRLFDAFLPFGQVAMDLGYVSQATLDWALALQEKLSIAAEERKRLGFYLMDAEVVKPSALAAALDAQAREGGMLGEKLVASGALQQAQLASILDVQAWQERYDFLG